MTRSILLVLLLLAPVICQSQDTFNSYWGGLEIEKELSKDFSLEFEEEFRYYLNQGEVDRLMTSLGGSYSINKWLKSGMGYTWIFDHNYKKDYFSNRHRINAYVKIKKTFGNFSFSLREKFQIDFRDESKEDVDYNPHNYLRTKFELNYHLKNFKIKPFISAQFRYQVNNPEGNEIDDVRYAFGIEYSFSKKIEFQAFYQVDKELNVKKPDTNRIFGTTLKFKY